MTKKQQTRNANLNNTLAKIEDVKTHEEMRQDEAIKKVNWKWRKVILAVMNGKLNYQAYNLAFKVGNVETDERAYKVAAAGYSQLLKNIKFREYWKELLEEQGFNDDVVDTQALKQITDPSTPENVRRAAIRDYNELHGRIIKRTDLTSGDKPIPILGLDHALPKNDSTS